jgi:hypothetical protein
MKTPFPPTVDAEWALQLWDRRSGIIKAAKAIDKDVFIYRPRRGEVQYQFPADFSKLITYGRGRNHRVKVVYSKD